MKTKTIRIDPFINTNRKYRGYLGRKFNVFTQIDNHGDYCLSSPTNEPFMFIASKDCMDLPIPPKQ